MHAKRNNTNPSHTRDISPKNGSVFLHPQELEISLSEVARYAGGSRYRMDSKMETLARSILNQAISLSRPAFGYTKHKIINTVPDKGFLIENNIMIPFPPDIPSDTVSVVSVICTIGPDLDEEIRYLNAKGISLETLYLDASGVALLEAVVEKAHVLVRELARSAGLYCGCQWAPGYEKTSLEDQKTLFDLVDASAIGVQLMQSGVMYPFKSLSFWIPLTWHPVTPVNRNKCRDCNLKGCNYRITHSVIKKA